MGPGVSVCSAVLGAARAAAGVVVTKVSLPLGHPWAGSPSGTRGGQMVPVGRTASELPHLVQGGIRSLLGCWLDPQFLACVPFLGWLMSLGAGSSREGRGEPMEQSTHAHAHVHTHTG